MCVQCGCLDPRSAAGNAQAWAEAGQRQSEAKLKAENATLKDRIDTLERRLAYLEARIGIKWVAEPEPAPVPEEGKPYKQPGVTW